MRRFNCEVNQFNMNSAEAPTAEIVMMKHLWLSAFQGFCPSHYYLLLFFSELPLGWVKMMFVAPGRTSFSAGTSVSVPQNVWFPLIEVIPIFNICIIFNVLPGSDVFPDPLFASEFVFLCNAFGFNRKPSSYLSLEHLVILPAWTKTNMYSKHIQQSSYWKVFNGLHVVKVLFTDTSFEYFFFRTTLDFFMLK